MAAWLGSYGAEAFGGGNLPRPGAVIMQYTGLSEYSESDPPTYACVGDRDGIANWRVMQARLEACLLYTSCPRHRRAHGRNGRTARKRAADKPL